jgi:hypothetical protein
MNRNPRTWLRLFGITPRKPRLVKHRRQCRFYRPQFEVLEARQLVSVYYISPSGSDNNSGASTSDPFYTFAHAIPLLQPGDTLVLMDGTYTHSTTGLPDILGPDNGYANPNAHDGTAAAPITIEAQDSRMAFLQGDGKEDAFKIENASYWNIVGLHVENTDLLAANGGSFDSFPFEASYCQNLNIDNMLAAKPNRAFNTHDYAIEWSKNITVADSEAYDFHRHGFDLWESEYCTIINCYANGGNYGDTAWNNTYNGVNYDYNQQGVSDEAFVCYGASHCTIENCISENLTAGFEVHGGPYLTTALTHGVIDDPTEYGGCDNRFLGCISLDDRNGIEVDSRVNNGPVQRNTFQNVVIVDPQSVGVYLRQTTQTTLTNVCIGSARTGTSPSRE